MLYRLIFKNLAPHKKEKHIQDYGVSLGSRYNGERTVYLFMIKNFFIEVAYQNDDPQSGGIENIKIFSNHRELNKYLVST
ncbi:MAG: hypothetical protein ABJH05_11260 [Fulvivirga sp.]